MNDDPGALPGETSLAGEPGAAAPGHAQPDGGHGAGSGLPSMASTFMPAPDLPAGPGPWPDYGLPEPIGAGVEPKSVLFIAWRDLANRQAGGSEVLVDRLASGVLARGHQVTLMCGGSVAERPYRVMRNGGTYSQFLRAPFAYLRHFRNYDLIVEVCNGMPFLAPLWCRRPVLCLVNHMHTELWSIRFRPPFSTVGRNIERVVMPWAHRGNLFLTVSPSTAESLQRIGVGQDRIRQICNGVEAPDPPTPRSPEPMFLAFGRLADYKRLDVVFTGRVSDQEKHRLMCSAWLFLHPALIEGWGIVVAEAAIRGTPAVAFDVPGVRDSVVHGQTGVLVTTEGQFASAWASLAIDQRRREQLGRAARTRALQLHWSTAVEGFAEVADEAIKRGGKPSWR